MALSAENTVALCQVPVRSLLPPVLFTRVLPLLSVIVTKKLFHVLQIKRYPSTGGFSDFLSSSILLLIDNIVGFLFKCGLKFCLVVFFKIKFQKIKKFLYKKLVFFSNDFLNFKKNNFLYNDFLNLNLKKNQLLLLLKLVDSIMRLFTVNTTGLI